MHVKPIYWICLALAIAFGIAVCDGLRTRDASSIIVGQMKAEKSASEKLNAEKDKIIAATRADNKKLTKENLNLVNTIGQLTNDIGQAKKSETKAKTESDKLKAEIQPAIDANSKLKEFVGGLEARLDQKDVIIAKYETLILTLGIPKIEGFINGIPFFSFPEGSITYNLNQLRVGEVAISESFKQKYENELHLRTLAEKGWKASENKLKWTRVMGNIKSGAILAAAGYIVFNAIKGKS